MENFLNRHLYPASFKKKQGLFIAFLFYFSFNSCITHDIISGQNLSYLYKKNLTSFHPEFSVWHSSNDSSNLYVKINPDEFLHTSQSEDPTLSRAAIRISYRLLGSFSSKVTFDSSATTIKHLRKNSSKDTSELIIKLIKFKMDNETSGLLEISIADLNRKISNRFFINVDKTNLQGRQFFLLKSKDNTPLFKHYFSSGEKFNIDYKDQSVSTLHVKYYSRKFPLASPPFIIENARPFDYQADSTFTINIDSTIFFNKKGFYHLQIDTITKEGLTLFRFNDDYPKLSSAEQLIEPLRYLTIRKEYEEFINSSNKKLAVDRFWLTIGGNQDRARELIRKYYSRVEEANETFGSYVEGWKTDRGLIYIIYGAPNIVYKTSNTESWTYGEANSMLSINFNFVKVNNPFTDNAYTLNRAPVYEANWYKAVDSWRQGRVFSDF